MDFRITQITELPSIVVRLPTETTNEVRLRVDFKASQHIGLNPYTLTAVLPSTGKFADLKIGQVWSFTAPEPIEEDPTATTEEYGDIRFKIWDRNESASQANCTDSWIDNKSWIPSAHTARENEAHEANEQTQRLLATLDEDEDPRLKTYWERHW